MAYPHDTEKLATAVRWSRDGSTGSEQFRNGHEPVAPRLQFGITTGTASRARVWRLHGWGKTCVGLAAPRVGQDDRPRTHTLHGARCDGGRVHRRRAVVELLHGHVPNDRAASLSSQPHRGHDESLAVRRPDHARPGLTRLAPAWPASRIRRSTGSICPATSSG